MSPLRNIAAIDIGTNSFHMVVASWDGQGFNVVTREKSAVRLGEGGGDMKRLSEDAIERGLRTLVHMKKIADVHKAEVFAVATSAVREADNGADFVARVAREAHVDIRVISGVEEARLIHLGAVQALPLSESRAIMIDIGGGSTEVIVADDMDEHFARSFKLGAVRLTNRFFHARARRSDSVDDCRKFVKSTVEPVKREVRRLGHDVAVVSSGTAETLARMCGVLRNGTPPTSMNGFEFERDDLASVTKLIADAPTIEDRLRLPGMDPGRADIILAGALILGVIADTFRIERFTFSEYALREGVLLDAVRRLSPSTDRTTGDVVIDSALKLCRRCDEDPSHAIHVSALACRIFDAIAGEIGLDRADRVYLEAAGLLANVGLTVSHARHHLHTYYIVRNADLLGLTDREIELVAQIARYHRKSQPKESHPPFAALDEQDKTRVRQLAGILRVAIGLDRTHDGRVNDVVVEVGPRSIQILAISSGQSDLDVNVYAANQRSALMSESLERTVTVTANR